MRTETIQKLIKESGNPYLTGLVFEVLDGKKLSVPQLADKIRSSQEFSQDMRINDGAIENILSYFKGEGIISVEKYTNKSRPMHILIKGRFIPVNQKPKKLYFLSEKGEEFSLYFKDGKTYGTKQ